MQNIFYVQELVIGQFNGNNVLNPQISGVRTASVKFIAAIHEAKSNPHNLTKALLPSTQFHFNLCAGLDTGITTHRSGQSACSDGKRVMKSAATNSNPLATD